MEIAVCLLVLNEYDSLSTLWPQINAIKSNYKEFKFYAVDGGSTDGTREFLEKNGIQIIGQSKRGRGEAFKIALKTIKSQYLVFFSPDGNENLDDLFKFKKLFIEYDLVIASRMVPGGKNEEDDNFLKLRKWGNLFFNYLANHFFNKSNLFVYDSINGFRGVNVSRIKDLKLTASDYTIEYQMTIQAMKNRLKIFEFPTQEGQRIAGKTKVTNLSAGFRFSFRLIKELLN